MNLLKLTWKNLTHKPLNLLLSLMLLGLGIGLISMLLLINTQLQEKFEKNLAGVDMVIGAKGSPLQVVLNSIFHVDYPTGNISLKEARKLQKHPFIEQAIELSMGDSYKGYRIIGTTYDYTSLYNAELKSGQLWKGLYEVTVGEVIANKLNLAVGSTFYGAHGLEKEGFAHDDGEPFKVVGILKKNNTVLDQLILTNKESVWAVHGHEGHDHDDHEGHDHGEHEGHNHDEHNHAKHDEHKEQEHQHKKEKSHEGHDHSGHDHDEHKEHKHAKHHEPKIKKTQLEEEIDEDLEITSMLIFFKNKMGAVTFPRMINENTDMQAASPSFEVARLNTMMGNGKKTLQALAWIIMIVSTISIFISLYNSMKDRKYEIALMRVMGASKLKIFFLVLIEGFIVAALGGLLGILLSHISLEFAASWLEETYRYEFEAWTFLIEECYLVLLAIGLGLIAAIIPAFSVYKTDISETLAEQ